MQIEQQIKTDVTTAMKAGDRERVAALRTVLSELQLARKDGTGDELSVLQRERKRRREAQVAYDDAGRSDLATREDFEAQLIESYLPSQLSDEELDVLVKQAITQVGASSQKEMGAVMKVVLSEAGGRADGKRVSTKVREALS